METEEVKGKPVLLPAVTLASTKVTVTEVVTLTPPSSRLGRRVCSLITGHGHQGALHYSSTIQSIIP